jgi:AcrR family transcriptional regulator
MTMAERPRATRTNEEMTAQTTALLLRSALRLFSAQGYAQTSIQEIAEAVGLTKGALYHHFRTKEEILRRLHDDMIDHGIAESRAVIAAGLAPPETLEGLIRAHVRMVETHQDAISVFLRERRLFEAQNWQAIKQKRDEIEDMFITVIAEGQRSGDFQMRASPRLIAYGILGMINWASEWYRPKRDDSAEIADVFSEMVLSGLARSSADA